MIFWVGVLRTAEADVTIVFLCINIFSFFGLLGSVMTPITPGLEPYDNSWFGSSMTQRSLVAFSFFKHVTKGVFSATYCVSLHFCSVISGFINWPWYTKAKMSLAFYNFTPAWTPPAVIKKLSWIAEFSMMLNFWDSFFNLRVHEKKKIELAHKVTDFHMK